MPHKVYPELKEGVIEECFKTNEQRLAKGKEPVRFLLIFDDSLSRETVHNNIINRVFIHGRIYMITPVVLQQSLSQIHMDWKRNTDIWFVFKPRTINDKMWAWENLLSELLETKQEAMELMNSIPKHTCMIIDYTGGETTFRQWKAPLVKIKN